jgi:protein-S-isoprenylcysteine O-methyltransferase Ste14
MEPVWQDICNLNSFLRIGENMETQNSKTKENAGNPKGVLAWVSQLVVASVTAGILLLLSAGRLDWMGGWAFFVLNLFTQLLSAWILIPRSSDLLAERSKIGIGTKNWDRYFALAVMVVGTLAVIITAGLDARFGWSRPISPTLWWTALCMAFAGQLFVLWAMASNRFFAITVRIQEERGHQVVSRGPYQFVRHPGYAGSILYTLAIPFVLGSFWTFIPASLTVALIIVRTFFEDRTLQAELPGYRKYTSVVHSRLFPGIW